MVMVAVVVRVLILVRVLMVAVRVGGNASDSNCLWHYCGYEALQCWNAAILGSVLHWYSARA